MKKQYLIYSDESYRKGNYFSNFYGGALVDYTKIQKINNCLNKKKIELNLGGEIKWSKVSATYLDKYIQIIDLFFQYVKNNEIKIRIMFRQNAYIFKPLDKTKYQKQFQLLYYQFIKHSFGLDFCVENENDKVYLKLYFDQLPDTLEKTTNLKNIFYI